MKFFLFSCLLYLCSISVYASKNPFIEDSNSCSSIICPEAKKFRWKVDQAAVYDYKANVVSTMRGVAHTNATLTLTARVTVHVLAPCEHSLSMENIKLQSTAVDQGREVPQNINSELFTNALEEHALRYSYDDGTVGVVCPSSEDPTWSINIKKAVVSALQNTMPRLDLDHEDFERDITGDCPTRYWIGGVTADGLVIHKERDLNLCSNRYSRTSHIQSVGYQMKTSTPNIPIVSSIGRCTQTVKRGQVVTVSCHEQHLLQPFSNGDAGAVTLTNQTLQLVEHTSSTVYKQKVEERSTLLYNHLPVKSSFESRENSLAKSEEILQLLCRNHSEVRLDTASYFLQLIGNLRGMNHDQLLSLYRLSAQPDKHAQKFIEDALPVVSTAASMRLMRDLMMTDEVDVHVANSWLLAMYFTPSVDLEMVEIAADLLNQKRPEVVVRSHLAVAALVRQFCQQHDNCESKSQVFHIVNQLTAKLGTDCGGADEKHEKMVLVALKSLANAGFPTSKLLRTLNACLWKRENPARIKIASIEAFRRFSCEVSRERIRSVFLDVSEDAEVRIAAYRALMACVSFKELESIHESLKSEPVNQVLSYVWSHLTNLQETSSAYQLEVQGLLADFHLQKKFSSDVRKFSRNMEISGFNSELHVGAILDSNLIYSSKSYIPRSLSTNLTIEMFGENINLLEIGVRTEGLESFVESLFAPGGLFNGRVGSSDSSKNVQPQSSQLTEMVEKFDAQARFGQPMAAFHMKIFGNEIDYIDLRHSDMIKMMDDLQNNNIFQWITNMKNKQTVDYSRTMNFLEGAYIVPTGLGLPLNLTATAVAAVNLQMSTQMQLDKLFSERKFDASLLVRPSGSVTFDGAMVVDAVAVQQGLNIRTTLHTSTVLDASMTVEGYNVVRANVNMPKERMDIYSFETGVKFIHQNGDHYTEWPIAMTADTAHLVEHTTCTGGALYMGWETCAHLHYINSSGVDTAPHFPLTGSANMALYVIKRDRTMTGYSLSWMLRTTDYDQRMRLEFDTPNSIRDRKFSLKLIRTGVSGKIKFKLEVPEHTLNGAGVSWWTPEKRGVEFSMKKEVITVVHVKTVFETRVNHNNIVYEPTFLIEFLDRPYFNFTGSVMQASVDSTLKRIMKLQLVSRWISLSLDSEAIQSRPLYQSQIVIKHNLDWQKERSLLLALESQIESDSFGGQAGHWMSVVDLDFSEKARLVRAIRWNWKNSPIGSQLLLQTAMTPEDFDDNVVFSIGYGTDYFYTGTPRRVKTNVELRYPAMGIDLIFSLAHERSNHSLNNVIMLRYAPERELRSVVNVTGIPLFLTGAIGVQWHIFVPQHTRPVALTARLQLLPKTVPSLTQACKFNITASWLEREALVLLGDYSLLENYESASMQHDITMTIDSGTSNIASCQTHITLEQSGVELHVQAKRRSDEYDLELRYYMASSSTYVERSLQTGLIYPDGHFSADGTLGLGDKFQLSVATHVDTLRDVQLEAHGLNQNGSLLGGFDLKWDAVNDPTRRVAFNFSSEHQRQRNSREHSQNVQATLIYPVNTIVLSANHYQNSESSQLVASSNVTIDYGWNDPVVLTSNIVADDENSAHHVSADIVVLLPYEAWRRNAFSMKYNGVATNMNGSLTMNAAGESLDVTMTAETDFPHRLMVVANMTTSVADWREAFLSINHRSETLRSYSSAELTANGDMLVFDVTTEDSSTFEHAELTLSVLATSTIQGFKLGGLHATIWQNDSATIGSVKTRLNDLWHDLALNADATNGVLSALVTVDQAKPSLNLLTAEVTVNPTDQGRSFQVGVSWPDDRLGLEGDFYLTSLHNFGLGFELLTPFESVGDVGLLLKHNAIKHNSIDSEVLVTWLQDRPLSLQLVGEIENWHNFDCLATLRLPIDKWHHLSVQLANQINMEDRSLMAKGAAIWNEHNVSVAFGGSASDGQTRVTVSLLLPVVAVQQIDLSGRFVISPNGTYHLHVIPTWHFINSTVQEIDLIGDLTPGAELLGAAQLTTPWYQRLTSEVSHQLTDQESVSRLSVRLGEHDFQLRSALKFLDDGGYNLFANGTSSLEWIPDTSFEALMAYQPHFNITVTTTAPEETHLTIAGDVWNSSKFVSAQLITPIAWLSSASAELKVEDSAEGAGGFDIDCTAMMPNTEEPLTLNGSLSLERVHITLFTPFTVLSTAELHFISDMGANFSRPQLTAVWNDHTVEVDVSAQTDSDSNVPTALNGTFKYVTTSGPLMKGGLDIRRQDESAYIVVADVTMPENEVIVNSKLFTGPDKFGLTYEVRGNELTNQESGEIYIDLGSGETGKKLIKLDVKSQYENINVFIQTYYSVEQDDGKSVFFKMKHPLISLKCQGKLLLLSIEQMETSGSFSLKTDHLQIVRALRFFHLSHGAMETGKVGVGWNLGEQLGKYHTQMDYLVSLPSSVDILLLAGPNVFEDRTLPTDLNVGLDVDRHETMGKAALTIEFLHVRYTLHADYSAELPYRANLRGLMRGGGSETAAELSASLEEGSPDEGVEAANSGVWLGSVNLTLPVEQYEQIKTRFTASTQRASLTLRGTTAIKPRSSFYRQSVHSLNASVEAVRLPEASASFSYLKSGRFSSDQIRTAAAIQTIYRNEQYGLVVFGVYQDSEYHMNISRTTSDTLNGGSVNVTTTSTALRELVGDFKVVGENETSWMANFSCRLNNESVAHGYYLQHLQEDELATHALHVINPLHPFSANISYLLSETLTKLSLGGSSLRNDNISALLSSEMARTATSSRLVTTLSLARHQLQLLHSSAQPDNHSSMQLTRLQLSPQLYGALHWQLNTSDQHQDGDSRCLLQLDLPTRSLALRTTAGVKQPRAVSDAVHGLRAAASFQWDLVARPEEKVEALVEFDDLSSPDNLYYNSTLTLLILDKPIALRSALRRSERRPLQLQTTLVYSPWPESHIQFTYTVVNQSRGSKLVYTTTLYLAHPATNFSLTGKGHLQSSSGAVSVSGKYTYITLNSVSQQAKVNFDLDRKHGDFNAKVTLPSILYELKSMQLDSEYRLQALETPLDYRNPRSFTMRVDSLRPTVTIEALYDAQLTKRLHVDAGVINPRHWQIHVFRRSGHYQVDDLVLFARLNHSHLFTSQARWRKEAPTELKNWFSSAIKERWSSLVRTFDEERQAKQNLLAKDLEKKLNEPLQIVKKQFGDDSDGTVLADYLALKQKLVDAYDTDVIYMKTMASYLYGSDESLTEVVLSKLSEWLDRLTDDMYLLSKTSHAKIQQIIQTIRSALIGSENGDSRLSDTLLQWADSYNQWVRALYLRVSGRVSQLVSAAAEHVSSQLMQLIESYRPQLLLLHHTVESSVVEAASRVINWIHGEVNESELFNWMRSMQVWIDQIYRDLSERDPITNLVDYSSKILQWAYVHTGTDKILEEPWSWFQQKWQNPTPAVEKITTFISTLHDKLSALSNQLGVKEALHRLLLRLYRGDDLWFRTSIQNAQRAMRGKAIMEMRPEQGYISFTQLLPMPWYRLNQSPVWKELPEVQLLRSFQSWTEESEWTLSDLIQYYWLKTSAYEWVPPFKGYAVLSGSSQIVTYDGQFYTILSDCSYLLTADMLSNRFSVSVQFRNSTGKQKVITLVAGNHSVVLGGDDKFSIHVDDRESEAPATVGEVSVVRLGDVVSLRMDRLLEISCNQRADLCSIETTGWMFGRTGGLLGNYDYESYSDLHGPDHLNAFPALFAASWTLGQCNNAAVKIDNMSPSLGMVANPAKRRFSSQNVDGFCWGLLGDSRSEYRICHRLVDPRPFLMACIKSRSTDRCVAIQAYVMACQNKGLPLKVPNKCVRCDIRGERVIEGRSVVVNNNESSTEVVFIVEAKLCNANITESPSISRLVAALEKSFRDAGFVYTRYAVVAFGGTGSLTEPRALTIDRKVFNSAGKAVKAFANIDFGSGGNEDVFGALRFAAMLSFSAGVSRTFVLLLCSQCRPPAQTFDHTTLANAFAEQQVTLHIVVHQPLSVAATANSSSSSSNSSSSNSNNTAGDNLESSLLGIDSDKAWTTSDATDFQGDADLLKSVQPDKLQINLCEPLARRATRGSIFSAARFRPDPRTGRLRLRTLRPLLTVLGRRVASTARPRACEECECVTAVDGTANPLCYPCSGMLTLDPEDGIVGENEF